MFIALRMFCLLKHDEIKTRKYGDILIHFIDIKGYSLYRFWDDKTITIANHNSKKEVIIHIKQ